MNLYGENKLQIQSVGQGQACLPLMPVCQMLLVTLQRQQQLADKCIWTYLIWCLLTTGGLLSRLIRLASSAQEARAFGLIFCYKASAVVAQIKGAVCTVGGE